MERCEYPDGSRVLASTVLGTTFDAEPGQVGSVPPGHDAWVLGDETAVLLDWAAATDYARG